MMARWVARFATPRTALVVGVILLVLLVAAVPLSLLTHELSQCVPFLPAAIVGLILARQRPRNPIGWVLVALALTMFTTGDTGQYAILAYRLHHPGLPLARLAVAANSSGSRSSCCCRCRSCSFQTVASSPVSGVGHCGYTWRWVGCSCSLSGSAAWCRPSRLATSKSIRVVISWWHTRKGVSCRTSVRRPSCCSTWPSCCRG